MNPGDLDFFSTRDLIDELLRRTTFQGVIIHAKQEVRTPSWQGERVFSVRHSANLDAGEAGRLMDVVRPHLPTLP
ncbi:hypothetical protein [Aquisphaera insulae]|uniref:hypothetical protein n=1 Tax=Aquisphaera insulae TaxID=2712864 RepID=UPI0013EC3B6C|nr:hypothetical protein [Aquisphaera insulae]